MLSDTLYADVGELLAQRLGFDLRKLGREFLSMAFDRARLESGIADESAWWREVHAGGQCWQQLVDQAVVTETWMFRDPAVHAYLASGASEMLRRVHPRPLRILSVPCSTGEEPYSVAMTLLDAGLSAEDFLIDAVDVSPRAVAKARSGHLGKHAFRGSAPVASRHVCVTEGRAGGVVSPRVRERVRFGVGNLVQGEGFDFTGEFDLVLCRNLLMYLLPSAQVIAVRRLVGALSEHGLLILGHAESGIAIKIGRAHV